MPLELLSPSPIGTTLAVTLFVQNPLLHAALRTKLAGEALRFTANPDLAQVALWEVPPSSDFPVLPESQKASPPLILALSSEDVDPMPLLAAGVRGVIPRNLDGPRLHSAIHAVAQGLVVLDEDLSDTIIAAWSPPKEPPFELLHKLTSRERDVLEMIAEGFSNREIAANLEISAHTVKFHVDALLAKLQARNRTSVVVEALRRGLLKL
jgi:two-component system, NarL family, nitrate/nitrite response regulator NarL